MVSIIIPVHNSSKFLRECLESCLKQSYKQVEIIAVENGSSDTSWELLQEYAQKGVQIRQIGKASAAKARNEGLKYATGAYFMFLDADDILSPNKIEHQVKAICNETDIVASCAWAKFEEVPEEAVLVEQNVWREENPVEWLRRSWMGEGMMQTACWLIPRNLIYKAGCWDESITLHDDGEFICRVLLESKRQIFVEQSIVYYRQHAGSLSTINKTKKAADSALEVYQSYERILQKKDDQHIRRSLSRNYNLFLYEFSPLDKELLDKARSRKKDVYKGREVLVGGRWFQNLTRLFGFENALRLKTIISQSRS